MIAVLHAHSTVLLATRCSCNHILSCRVDALLGATPHLIHTTYYVGGRLVVKDWVVYCQLDMGRREHVVDHEIAVYCGHHRWEGHWQL